MSGITCPNCGIGVEYGMKFCRRCGTPLDGSEAATRTFDEPVRVESLTQPTTSSPTTPSFAPPSYAPPVQQSPQTPATNSLEQTGQKKTVWILAGVAVISLVAVIVLVVMLLNKPSNDRPAPPGGDGVTQPQGPPPPPPPPGGGRGIGTPPPPAPPVAPDINSLSYPGAQETMRVAEGNSKVLGLRTSDALDKVVEYYKAKTGLTTQILAHGEVVILAGENLAITISREGNATNILVASGTNSR